MIRPGLGKSNWFLSSSLRYKMATNINMDKECAADEAFWFTDGRKCTSLRQLIGILQRISDDSFSQYVHSGKNDFANWISKCLHYPELSDSIQKITGREELVKHLGGIKGFMDLSQDAGADQKSTQSRMQEGRTPAGRLRGCQDDLERLKQRISVCRKNGLDMKIAELLCMNIPPKIRYAEITTLNQDIIKVEELISKARSEIEEAEAA